MDFAHGVRPSTVPAFWQYHDVNQGFVKLTRRRCDKMDNQPHDETTKPVIDEHIPPD